MIKKTHTHTSLNTHTKLAFGGIRRSLYLQNLESWDLNARMILQGDSIDLVTEGSE